MSEGRQCLVNNIIKQLQHAVQRTIYVNDSVDDLQKGLLNSINHVFGDHFECQNDCQEAGNINNTILEEYGILYHIKAALDRVVMLAENLIGNETSNKAEMFMSLLAKYNAGKRLNLITRGSFETQANIAVLRYNKGINWHADSWRNITDTEEGENLKIFLKRMVAKEQSRKQLVNKNISKTESSTGSKQTKKSHNTDYGPSVPATVSVAVNL
ncbi:unnamed protein product [Psylliodes chrysocephalus]|uniref:Uncharacterized protein n=1 Tax=Psylliodes chrysocephalus TaxID=3402493 RepID=A0A9P0D5R8_9CUCU|nr:unnamed protein product [Psylliodes chrysocephala]